MKKEWKKKIKKSKGGPLRDKKLKKIIEDEI